MNWSVAFWLFVGAVILFLGLPLGVGFVLDLCEDHPVIMFLIVAAVGSLVVGFVAARS